jgi:hypothetical protein
MSKTLILKAIKEGWGNYLFPVPRIEALAKQRAEICSECPHANLNGLVEKMMPDRTLEKTQGLVCNLCKCPLSTKLRQALQECPDSPPRW